MSERKERETILGSYYRDKEAKLHRADPWYNYEKPYVNFQEFFDNKHLADLPITEETTVGEVLDMIKRHVFEGDDGSYVVMERRPYPYYNEQRPDYVIKAIQERRAIKA